ncbi:cobyrinate a,c-diamide synthase [Anaerosinus massiliensis]|uniref:cobyrinate a,c-diamide synthase n=1 Tax=Massilibacillus massiliensis TaxID=1806837 RepID=UPI000A978BF5|nr:cobyrinate a,c-diamide synthase [Massilibacillus massiliensis]
MTEKNIPRIVIAATNSGAGKTTIVTGILAAMKSKGYNVQSYKIGPDYIDPGYHQLASEKPGHNLDTWLVPATKINEIFTRTAESSDIAIIEGVMGLYDGGRKEISSTATIAKLLKAPIILVIDAKSMGESAAAIALGFKMFDPKIDFAGVIINRLGSQTHKKIICDAMAKINIPVLGCIFRENQMTLPQRHLGLTPVTENQAGESISVIRDAVLQHCDIDSLYRTAKAAPPIPSSSVKKVLKQTNSKIKIGVAHDEAFSFYYPESLDVLEELGAEIVFFSPLHDQKIPDIQGLIFGGGFPEMFAKELSENQSMQKSIYGLAEKGLPIYAECGGLMYLTKSLKDFSENVFNMVGLIPATCQMHDKLQTVGYIEAEALNDSILCPQGTTIHGHEFHFSSMSIDENLEKIFPWAFKFTKLRTGKMYYGGYATDNILASYLHLHFAGNINLAKQLIEKCYNYIQK